MTKLIFLGTKGEIEESTEKHQYHSSLLLISQNYRLLIDHGKIHKMDLATITPDGIMVTHAHPDHYIWLNEEVNIQVPVYLTNDTYNYGKYKPSQSNIIKPGIPFQLGPFDCLAYRVIHSLRCPTVGYKIYVEGNKIAYNPDLIDIINKDNILRDVSIMWGMVLR
jgi:ribonuclease BN (tRNA processing enzyme)